MPSLIGECELVYICLSYIILLAVADQLTASRWTESGDVRQTDGWQTCSHASLHLVDGSGWEGWKEWVKRKNEWKDWKGGVEGESKTDEWKRRVNGGESRREQRKGRAGGNDGREEWMSG